MSTHKIHEEEIYFDDGTGHAEDWLRDVISEKGLQKFLEKAKHNGKFYFHDDFNGEKFTIEYTKKEKGKEGDKDKDKKEGFHVYKH